MLNVKVCAAFIGAVVMCSGAMAYPLRLNEIFFQSALPDRPVMIELQNTGGEALDISGYTLADCENHTYSFPAGATVAPHGIAVAVFGRAEQVADLLNEEAAWFFCDDEALNQKIFQEKRAQFCALYATADLTESRRVDMVSWGHEAFTEMIFNKNQQVTVRTIALYPGDIGLSGGGSLVYLGQWQRQGAKDMTIGLPNRWPTPTGRWVNAGEVAELASNEKFERQYRFMWSGQCPPGGRFHLQAALDPRFKKLMIDELHEGARVVYSIDSPRFFWRVRWEKDREAGYWSPIYKVEYSIMNKPSQP